ncbi:MULTISPECIES: zinc-ribbon domain-containing protein [unclassified Gluconobacter]|uniref:zinc-ribbon domain-containing protein n=1 Tax=unclassified Gluconobacter TaxID=2644261 RepID=UPI001C03CB46|nr:MULTISPECIES: zinc-ribbon domain-containing protein [unclassified Gluconobacter]
MRVECPHCHAVFEVPDSLLEQARRLRCANCGDSWPLQEAHEPELADDLSSLKTETEEPSGPEASQSCPVGLSTSEARDAAKHAFVLHSRTVTHGLGKPETVGTKMIGSLGAWSAAWGLSLVVIGGGVAALWHWKAGELVTLWPGIGHVLTP